MVLVPMSKNAPVTPPNLTRGRVGAHDDDGDGGRRRVVPEALEDLVAAQIGQVQVEQYQGGLMLPDAL